MLQIFATSAQSNVLFILCGGFILIGSYFFGRLVTFFFPKNPLIRKNTQKNQK